MPHAVTFPDILAAAQRLRGHAHRTPVLTSAALDDLAGATLLFKAENLQLTGSFKFRGAFNAIASLPEHRRARGVITFSSGNHGQAIALAARLHGIPATVVMPRDAPLTKRQATEAHGAEVIFYDRYAEDRQAITTRLADERRMTLIPPFNHPGVIAGQGTVALELIEDAGPLDALVVCLGGGGLLAGCAIAARHLCPGCTILGVEPLAGNDAQQSFRAGRIITIPVPQSIADGALTTALGDLTFPIIHDLADVILTVTDDQLRETGQLLQEHLATATEPTGCLAAAAVLQKLFPVGGRRIGVIISGGNSDPSSISR